MASSFSSTSSDKKSRSTQPATSTTSVSAIPLPISSSISSSHSLSSSSSSSSPQPPPPLDFIGSSHAVKNLFSLPYHQLDQPVSVALHNLGGALLIDADDHVSPYNTPMSTNDAAKIIIHDHPFSKKLNHHDTSANAAIAAKSSTEEVEEDQEFNINQLLITNVAQATLTPPTSPRRRITLEVERRKNEAISSALVAIKNLDLNKNEAFELVNSALTISADESDELCAAAATSTLHRTEKKLAMLPSADEYMHHYVSPAPEPREYLTWKFQSMNLLVGSTALIYRSPETAITVRVEEIDELKAKLQTLDDWKKYDSSAHTFLPVDDRLLKNYERVARNNSKSSNRLQSNVSYADATRRRLTLPPQDSPAPINDPSSPETNTEEKATMNSSNIISRDNYPIPAHHSVSPLGRFPAQELAQVRLQTCIVAAPLSPVGGQLWGRQSTTLTTTKRSEYKSSSLTTETTIEKTAVTARDVCSPISTVLDIYLDNIMANVPQLALCLRGKGFVQSVKLLQTEEIPTHLLTAQTLDISSPFDIIQSHLKAEKLFEAQVMESNAATLLRFLKTNCTRDNSTYLLRREAGQTNIQLYDITTISTQRQRQWVWWLAMMSCRFANRLRHIAATKVDDNTLRRNSRARQRSLLQNALDLLEVLADMDGSKHESLVSAVCENLADTFLFRENEQTNRRESTLSSSGVQAPSSGTHAPSTSSSVVFTEQPYENLSADALNKAQDHLKNGIKGLEPLLLQQVQDSNVKPSEHFSLDTEFSVTGERPSPSLLRRVEPAVTQLFGMYHKLINISLRLAEIHLRNYFSSSAMQALRTSARAIAASLHLVQLLEEGERVHDWISRIQLQYTWLWEHCGHFARSFAGDDLWRDRGHASGDDVISVLQDAERAFSSFKGLNMNNPSLISRFIQPDNHLSTMSNDLVNLQSLSGVVIFVAPIGKSKLSNIPAVLSSDKLNSLNIARCVLDEQHLILRDRRRVLVAASVAYSQSIQSFREFAGTVNNIEDSILSDSTLLQLLQQRLGDACNEIGKILLNELRLLLTSGKSKLKGDTLNLAAEILLASSQFWFFEGLASFEECHDVRNLALLRCNLCQSYKFRANHMFSQPNDESVSSVPTSPTHAELCLQEASNHLQAAHESLSERDIDPVTWDMVSEELAATFLVLGVRRRQSLIGSGSNPSMMMMQTLRLTPGKEHSIVDPMDRSRKIYQQLGNRHQEAACHYQLALYYSKVWTFQVNESKTREKLAAAFAHFHSALAYFRQAVRGNEVTYVILCLDASNLYSIVSGMDSNRRALEICLMSVDAFSPAAIETSCSSQEWFRQMKTLATSMEEAVFKRLRSLVKLEEEQNRISAAASASGTTNSSLFYKDLFRTGLTAKLKTSKATSESTTTGSSVNTSVDSESFEAIASHLRAVHLILTTLHEEFHR